MNQPQALTQRQIESACRHYQSVLKAQRTFFSKNKEVIKEKRRQRYAFQKQALIDSERPADELPHQKTYDDQIQTPDE